ncbi:ABC transporter permease [Parapedobacter koreensis]|uniref:ABC-type antimicrobial peptide transport system, permease component n=1 Tax=Parapedobacter koreensis TaxID=332977 RepID=A0A1H7R3B8_9SPHI|nr:ABC transporter permease [Parapedobacter koreensis]SEL54653.1 ABC-type antimicrobial peptide transport system, permease component [Parapedobacter koreensis]
MIKNYIKTAFRTLVKNRSYSAINIIGLAVSLTASVLLMLWVWDELSYDRMHDKADRIYVGAAAIGKSKDQIWPVTNAPLAIFGKAEIPAIEDACRLSSFGGNTLFEYGDKKFNELSIYVDSTFFRIFDFQLLEGNPGNPFPDNRSIVLSEETAKKYFGDEPAMGKVLRVKNGDNFTVTGVMEDSPKNSTWGFPLLMPFGFLSENRQNNPLDADWGNLNYQTFFLLKPDANAAVVGKQLADIHRKNQPADFWKDLNYLMQPLTKYHLYSPDGDEQGMKQVKIFAMVAMVILLIACINYVNLVTARSTRRSKEVSVRKVVGANKAHLFGQFIAESFVVFLVSLLIAIGLLFALMPLYNSLSGKEMVFSLLDGKVWAIFGVSLLLVLALAGVYPALMLSSFNPALALKGIIPGLGKNSGFRKALVVVQFTCSVVLIVATLIISRQLEYIRQLDLGYSKENVFTFESHNFRKNYESIRDQLEQQSGVLGVTASTQCVLNVQSSTGDLEWEGKPANMASFMISQLSVDRTFPKVMDMELVAGQGFTGTAADSNHYLLNETAIKVMGLEDPIGKPVTFHGTPGIIAGVVKDFHFKDMKTTIEPCILFMDPDWGWNTMYVKTTGADAAKVLAAVEGLWKTHNADYEFNYTFMDQSFDELYKSDIRSGKLFNVFAGVAILLSCLGLFGLVTYTAETKVKEIGIRKTLGASVSNIILLISKDFLKLVGISFLVAFPLGWWMMNRWLDNYVYRTSMEWWVFVVAGLTAFAIAAITVCGKSLRAARENPIKAIRTE